MHRGSLRDRFRALRQRWSEYVGDRDLEQKIRAELVREGLPRRSHIRGVELVAIQPPGWIQVYRFRIEDPRDGDRVERWGVASDDGRRGTRIRLCCSELQADDVARSWSEGMIVKKR